MANLKTGLEKKIFFLGEIFFWGWVTPKIFFLKNLSAVMTRKLLRVESLRRDFPFLGVLGAAQNAQKTYAQKQTLTPDSPPQNRSASKEMM